MQYTYHAGDPSIWLTGVPEFLLRAYIEELPKLRARNILDMIEAFIVASPAQSEDDLKPKQRRLRELQREASGGEQEKPQMTMQQFAGLMGAMGMGFEVIEGEVNKG